MDTESVSLYAPRLVNQFSPVLRNFIRELCGPVLVHTAIKSLREASTKVKNVDQSILLAWEFRSTGIRILPGQIRSEITQLLNILAENPPRRVLEIGTAGGGTFYLFARVAAKDAVLISADLPHGLFGGGYPKWRGRLIQSFGYDKQQVHLLAVDSHAPETLQRIQALLNPNQLDFLFIDGDHRYEGVKADFEMYSPLVRPGGLIGFHDIVPGPPDMAGGVAIFWQELKKQFPVREFVADWNQGGYGIGLLVKPG